MLIAAAGCGDDDAWLASLDDVGHPDGSLQARVELTGEARQPFLADEVLARLSGPADRLELVVHAADRDDRRNLSLVIEVGPTDLPGTLDLSRHLVVYTEVDAAGTPVLVLDDIPFGTLDLSGDLRPGGEIAGSFQFDLPESGEDGSAVSGRFEGAFIARLDAEAG